MFSSNYIDPIKALQQMQVDIFDKSLVLLEERADKGLSDSRCVDQFVSLLVETIENYPRRQRRLPVRTAKGYCQGKCFNEATPFAH